MIFQMPLIKIILIGLAVGILIGAIIWVSAALESDVTYDETMLRIKQSLILPRVTFGTDMISQIDSNAIYMSTFADHAYPGWNVDTDKFKELVLFAIKLLDFWATYGTKKSKNYPQIVTSIVVQVVKELEARQDLTSIPWGTSWYVFSALVTRMFATFEYVGSDVRLKRRCHKQLVRITPSVGTTHQPPDSPDYDTLNMFYVAVPRLASNYMFDRAAFDVDQRSSNFSRIEEFFNFKRVDVDEPKSGVYRDLSWIDNGSVASYELLFVLYNFHERVYSALDFKNSIRELAEAIIPKLLHPQIPYRPLGLSGRSDVIYDTTPYWDVVPNSFGGHIMPYIGFGVLKSPDYLLYVRVQRPGIAAYISNAFDQEKIFALAWVQLPKLYVRAYKSFENYDATVTAEGLASHPGLILVDGEDYKSNVLSARNDHLQPFHADGGSIDSFIGVITTPRDKDILFWKNQFKLSKLYGDCTITEFGMALDTHVHYQFVVTNNSDRELTFRHRVMGHYFDSFLLNREKLQFQSHDPNVVRIPKRQTTTIDWAVKIREAWLGRITSAGKVVTFEANYVKFEVEVVKPNNTFVVKFGEGKKLFAGGSSSSNPESSFEYDGITLVRNKDTMMYFPKETN